MGNSDSHQHRRSEFNEKQWKQIPLVSYTNNSDPYYSSKFKVLAHRTKKHLHAEKYNLFFNSQAQYHSYLELYNTRKYSPYLVNPFYIQQTTSKNMCATFHSALLYIERIPLRLYEITDVPLVQGLYMIECALEGFEKIMEKTGYFQVSSDMICINQQGKVKVWLNCNLSKNFPEFNKIDHNKGEVQFVRKILDVIEDSIDYGKNRKFSSTLYEHYHEPSFKLAKAMLKEYCKQHRIVPNKVMKSVLIIYKGDFSYDELNPSVRNQNTKCKRHNENKLGRKSYDRLPDAGIQLLKNSTTSETLHMSFIKNFIDFQYVEPLNYHNGSQEKNKNPPVSFFYKSKGLSSPQNEYRESAPISVENTPKKTFKAQKMSVQSTSRKTKYPNNCLKRKQTQQNLYFSTQRAFEIDPDIAKDLDALDF